MKMFLSSFLFFALLQVAFSKTAAVKEINTYVEIGGINYAIGKTMHNVDEAEALCAGLGMKLAALETEAENSRVKDYLSINGFGGFSYWTSGCKSSGVWTWSSTNTLFDFLDWNLSAGEPDYDGIEACLHVAPSTGWFDGSCCDTKLPYLCEQS